MVTFGKLNCHLNKYKPDKISKNLHILPYSGGNDQSLHLVVSKWYAQRIAVVDSLYLSVSEVIDDFTIFPILNLKYINSSIIYLQNSSIFICQLNEVVPLQVVPLEFSIFLHSWPEMYCSLVTCVMNSKHFPNFVHYWSDAHIFYLSGKF